MSTSAKRFLIAGLLFFVIGLLANFPARVAYHWFAPESVQLANIGGTLWNGRAAAADIQGVYVSDLQWQFRPLALLTAKFGIRVSAKPAGGTLAADAAFGLGGSIALRDLKAVLPLAAVSNQLGVAGLGGMARIDFSELDLDDGFPSSADGVVEVSQLILPTVADVAIGGYKSEWFNEEDGLVGVVEDTDGSIDVAGRISLLADRSYSFLAQVAAKPQSPAAVSNNLRVLGSPNERGQYELRLEGVL